MEKAGLGQLEGTIEEKKILTRLVWYNLKGGKEYIGLLNPR